MFNSRVRLGNLREFPIIGDTHNALEISLCLLAFAAPMVPFS